MGACPQRVGIGPEASRCDVDAGPTVGPDGVIYTGGDGIYAINPDGTLRWHFVTGGHVSSAPAVLPDGTVVAGCQDDLVYAIAPNGQKRWDFRAGADVEAAPAIGDDGTIYVGSDDDKLYALAPGREAALGVHHRGRRARVGGGRQRRHLRRFFRFSTLCRPTGRHAGVDIPRRRSHRVVGARRRHAAPSCSARRMTAFIVSSLTAICAGRSSSAATSTARRRWPRTAPSSWAPTTASSTRSARRAARRRQPHKIGTQLTVNDTSGGSGFSGLPTRKLTGRIKIHPAGYGFVVPDDKSEDVHVSARNRGAAMDADTVEIEAWPAVRGVEGRVLRVLARGRAKITGQLARAGQGAGPAARRSAHRRPGHAARARSRTRPTASPWSPRSPAIPTSPTGRSRPPCSRCWATPTTRAPRSRRCWPAPTSRRQFPDDVARIADGVPTRGARRRPRRPHRPARRPVHDHRSRDGARLRRRGRDRIAAERRHAPVGRGRRRLALRARRDRRWTPRRSGAAAASTCPTAPSRCCPSRCRRASARWCPEEDRLAMVVAHRPRPARAARRQRILRGGDSFARAARLSGRGGGAGRRHARQAEASTSRSCPTLRAMDSLARQMRVGAARARRARLRSPRTVHRARPRRSAAGARHPEVAPRSGRAAGVFDDRGVHAGRQRGGRAELPRAQRGHALAHPRRARSRAAGGVRGAGARTTASRSTSTRRARPRASSGCSTG